MYLIYRTYETKHLLLKSFSVRVFGIFQKTSLTKTLIYNSNNNSVYIVLKTIKTFYIRFSILFFVFYRASEMKNGIKHISF